MGSNTIYCFLDTNVLIHFEPFDEVDWPKKLQAAHVHLVLAPSVLRELNKFKDDNTNGPRRKRVRAILPKLERLLEQGDVTAPGPIRNGVTIFDISREPQVAWSASGLDPLVEDDRLIGSILEFVAQHGSVQALLVSGDFLARRKAKSHGIRALGPQGLIAPKELPSADDAERKKLQREVQAYKNRVPKLSLSFWENGAAAHPIVRPAGIEKAGRPTDAAVEQHLAQKRQEFDRIIAKASGRAQERDINAYRRKCSEYLADLRVLW